MKAVWAVLEVVAVAVVTGLILTTFDGAMVGEYRWRSDKLLVYSVAMGAILFLVPYAAVAVLAFLGRLFVRNTWPVFRTHRFALVASSVITAVLLWGLYYGATHYR